jgi:hypothetical protein
MLNCYKSDVKYSLHPTTQDVLASCFGSNIHGQLSTVTFYIARILKLNNLQINIVQ